MEITVAQYQDAIQKALSLKQVEVLQTLYDFPNSTATAKELAAKLKYTSYLSANSQIGAIGKAIAKHNNVDMAPHYYLDRGVKKPSYFLAVGSYYPHEGKVGEGDGWEMRDNLRKALENSGIVEAVPKKCNMYLFNWDFYYKSQQAKLDWRNSYEKFKKEGVASAFYSVNFTREKGRGMILAELPSRLKDIKPGDKVLLSKKIFLSQQEIDNLVPYLNRKNIDKSKIFTLRRPWKYGIIGSGKVFQELLPVPVVDDSGDNPVTPLIYKENNFVIGVDWDTLLDFENGEILMVQQHSLKHNKSGSLIKPEIADVLEKMWTEYIEKAIQDTSGTIVPYANKELQEGAPYEVIQTRYERDQNARKDCLNHYGYSCNVCSFNFEKEYGNLGKDFIHVHHLTPISQIGKNYQIDPIKDLVPVCPNCHSMIHRKKEKTLTIEELKSQIKSSK